MQRTVLDLETVYVNGGRRGLLVAVAPRVFTDLPGAVPVDVEIG